jgi:hypothetical protein
MTLPSYNAIKFDTKEEHIAALYDALALYAETYYATDLLDGADFGLTTPYHFAKSARAALDYLTKEQNGQQETA